MINLQLYIKAAVTRLSIIFLSSIALTCYSVNLAEAQFFRSLFQENSQIIDGNMRDDPPDYSLSEELSYDEIICRDRNSFPKIVAEVFFNSYFECKNDLDRIEDASYINLTYRIRWDEDRLDLHPSGYREIYICDGFKQSKYEHDKRKDPDWWMISRNSLDLVTCSSDYISVEKIE